MALERQVGDSIDATFAADLLVPAGATERRRKYFRRSSTEQKIHSGVTLIERRLKVR